MDSPLLVLSFRLEQLVADMQLSGGLQHVPVSARSIAKQRREGSVLL